MSLSSTLSLPGESSPALAQLSSEQRQRLTDVLDRYLAAQERGQPLDQDALLEEHPDLAAALRVYFRSLADLHDIAAGFAPWAPDGEPWPGAAGPLKRLGDFEIIREIGRGGMGVVYEARQISLDRAVALKVLPFAAVLDAKQIARFKHEAQAAAQLHHPNIVPVFAIGVERGVHYYAMQLINGQALDRAIAELRSALNLTTGGWDKHFRTVCRLGIQAAEALQAAHEYGVVHRDIKPSNLLLEADGRLWVADFGLARCRASAALTRTGDLIGTLRYMSPEQAAGNSACVDQRTDIYSLGATLYELACLRPAFAGCVGPALLHRIERQDPLRPRQVQPEIPADLETVILKALAKDRGDRYASAQALANDLRRILEGQPTLAKPPTSIDRVLRLARRHRRTVGAVLAALLTAIVGLSASLLLYTHEAARAERNAADARRHLDDAQNVLAHFGVDLAQRLADVPGAEHVRQDLLKQTQVYYENFAKDAEHNPSLKENLAQSYGKIALLLDEAGTAEEAVAAHRKAVELLGQLTAAQPQAACQKMLAQAENHLGLALSRSGHAEQARQQFLEAIRRQERLLATEPDDERLLADLAKTYSNLGLVQHALGHDDEAQASLKHAIDLVEKASSAQPNDPDQQNRLAGLYDNLAATYLDTAPAKAVELYERALALQIKAGRVRPEDAALRSSLSLTFHNLAAALARMGRLQLAQENYGQAIAIREELARRAPAERTPQRDLATSLNNRGLDCHRMGWIQEAESTLRRALAIEQRLVEQTPDDVTGQSSLGGIWHNLGVVLASENRTEEAAAALASGIEHQTIAVRRAPQVARYRELLDKHRRYQARLLRKLDGIAAVRDPSDLLTTTEFSVDRENSEP